MKIWKRRTWKNKKFYRLNHEKMSKNKFWLAYYQILHTAYAKKQSCGILETIKTLFFERFGCELNQWSMSYISDTEKCFGNDDITDVLTGSGRIECPDKLRRLLVEIGFDVYLIQTAEAGKKPGRNRFYQWLPIKKDRGIKKMVRCFWKERLPKERWLLELFYHLEPFKNDILSTYRILLSGNDTILTAVPEKDSVLAYIDQRVPLPKVQKVVLQETEPVRVAEPIKFQKPVITPVIPVPEPAVTVRVKQQNVDELECRGFHENNTMTKKKLVTCAVCIAAAGALLIPVAAYAVMKHKQNK